MTEQLNMDNHKLIYHPDRITEWFKEGDCYPIYVEIGPINFCNHKCVFCALDFLENKKVSIKKEVLSSALEDMTNHGVKSVMFAGEGEPLLHRDIGFFTQDAKKYGLDVSITTNSVLFTQEKREQCLPNLKWIRFSIDSGSPENYSKIHGIKISDIKFPDRELIDINFYIPKEFTFFKSEKRMAMFSSIGCPHNCTFCDVKLNKIERKSPEKIVEEMEYLYKLGSRSIHLFDDNFNVNEKHLNLVIDEMKKKNFFVEWSGRGQAKMSDELTKRLTENGFKRIHVGFESLDDKILKFFNKKVNYRDIEKFCNTMNKYSVDILAYFIVGAPMETELYRKELKNKVKELGIKHPYIQILYSAPNTIYYHQLLKEGIYKKDIWKEFMENPTPDFVPPYSYNKNLLEELIKYVDEFEEEYRKDKNEKII